MIWQGNPDLEQLNAFSRNTLFENLGIEFTQIGSDFIEARMPVDHRTIQPDGLLHGGANVALAETLGSVASVACLEDRQKQTIVGVEINANHLLAVKTGYVTGRVMPIRLGRTMHVWEIKIRDDQDNLSCVSRLTIMVINRREM